MEEQTITWLTTVQERSLCLDVERASTQPMHKKKKVGHSSESTILHDNNKRIEPTNNQQQREKGDSGGCLAMSSLGI